MGRKPKQEENKIDAWRDGNDVFFLLPMGDGLHVTLWKVKDAEQITEGESDVRK